MAYDHIEKLNSLLGENEIRATLKTIAADEKRLSEIMRRLTEMEAAIEAKRAEEAAKAQEALRLQAEQEAEQAKKAAEMKQSEKPEPKKQEQPLPEPAAPQEKPKEAKEAKEAKEPKEGKEAKAEPVEVKADVKPEIKPAEAKREAKPEAAEAAPQAAKAPAQAVKAPAQAAKPSAPAAKSNAAQSGARPPYGAKPNNAVASRNPSGTPRNPSANNRTGDGARPVYRPDRGDRTAAPNRPARPAPSYGSRQGENGTRPARPPMTPRPTTGGARFSAPAPTPAAPKREFSAPKKFDKTYVEKRPVNKRALQRQQGTTVGDFDEDKSGYRKARFSKKGVKKEAQTIRIDHAVVTTREIPIKVLSEKLGISAVEITKRLFREGIMKTVNESVDYDDAAFVALELGIDLEYKPAKTAEDELLELYNGVNEENLITRAPVVTVMGHVDHGKTSLLDAIRKTNVTAGEAGGITQSIGAYTVSFGEGKKITFIDTPGHAAFTAMRARGAQVTDIVVLVVAADDGIMPQTVEAIDHAKAAEVPIIVAMNKMDKPHVDPDKVKQGLTEHGLVPEEWGGDVIVVPVSAKTGDGIDALLESINLVAEMQELRADPERNAKGVIIEAKLDKGKGPMASVLVQNGTLHTGDNLISGTTMGRVRAMIDDKGRTVKEAGPSMAVSVLGLEDVPNAGDAIFAVEANLMKQVQEERKSKQRESMIRETTKVTLDDVFAQVADGMIKDLKIIVKADVQGSVEAVKASLEKLSNEEVRVKVIHAGAGAINESDIMLADSANAIVIGFNVRPDTKAKALAERSKVDVRSYRIIYELLDDMEAALKGMLAPKYHEVYMGKAEVKQTFNITGVGTVAGCFVTEGKLVRGGKLRIYRDDIMIVEGGVKQLKRFKDDAKEVSGGFECGCAIDGFNEIKIGDFIECYLIEEIKQG